MDTQSATAKYYAMRHKNGEHMVALRIIADYRDGIINDLELWQTLSDVNILSGAVASDVYANLGYVPHEGYPLVKSKRFAMGGIIKGIANWLNEPL